MIADHITNDTIEVKPGWFEMTGKTIITIFAVELLRRGLICLENVFRGRRHRLRRNITGPIQVHIVHVNRELEPLDDGIEGDH